MEERPHPEGLSEGELAEADAESDVTDADIEDAGRSHSAAAREAVPPDLAPEDLAEAEAEADLVDADIEDA